MAFDYTEDEIQRYSRHILLKEVGVEGQERIGRGRVLVVGAGGLGAPVLMYLAAAGVGTLGVVDGDVVDLTNLQRQIVHFTGDVGHAKTQSAKEKLLAINPRVVGVALRPPIIQPNSLPMKPLPTKAWPRFCLMASRPQKVKKMFTS